MLLEDIERVYQGEALTVETYDSLQLGLDEKALRDTDALPRAKAVYDGIFSGVSVDSLPAPEKTTDETGTGKAAAAEYAMADISADAVTAFCNANQLTENALFTAAFALLLMLLSGGDEALFASVYNGRTRLETLRIMGMLVKTYPIYVQCNTGEKSNDFILSVQKRIQALTANDLYSFAEAARDYGVNADVLFVYQGDAFTDFKLAGRRASEIARPLEDAKAPLSVNVWKKDGMYTASFEYRKDMYTQALTRWMADAYGMLLSGLMTRETLGEIPLCSDEAEAFLNTINDTDVPVPFRPVHCLLEAVNCGLDAKIMRLGNLMGRHCDGEFQANFRSNAFVRSLASYKAIGAMPYSVLNARTDFSEIDMTAQAVLLLSGTSREYTVFHPVNNHTVTYADIAYAMREYGFRVDAVEDEEFEERMADTVDASGALITYNSHEGGQRRFMLGQDCAFTTNALYRLGFKWPVSGEKYIVSMLKALDALTMFDN